MSTHKLGMPFGLRRRLEYELPRQGGMFRPTVRVTSRGRDEKRSAAWCADHYEVHAFYATSEIESLAALEDAMKTMPGVYLTTQVRVRGIGRRGLPENEFTNPAWPAALGAARRDRNSLRVQVIALIRDEGTA